MLARLTQILLVRVPGLALILKAGYSDSHDKNKTIMRQSYLYDDDILVR